MEQLVRGMRRLHQPRQLCAQRLHLVVVEHLHAGQKSVAVKRLHLFISEAILLPVLFMRGQGPQRASGCMQLREILHHGTFSVEWGSGYERGPSRLFYITAATDDKPVRDVERALDRLGRPAVQSIIDISIVGVAMPKRRLDPLPAAAFQILLSLTERDLHGYAIMRQVEEQTAGKVRLGPGTLYSSIQALLEERLIAEVEAALAPAADNSISPKDRRRLYRLTSSGRKVARTEAERLADILRIARAKKILRGEYV